MSNSRFAPKGINPFVWKKIQAKRRAQHRAEMKAIYTISPILWAVVKGADTPDDLTNHLPSWRPDSIERGLKSALESGHVRRWGGRLLPTQERHKVLKRRLSHR